MKISETSTVYLCDLCDGTIGRVRQVVPAIGFEDWINADNHSWVTLDICGECRKCPISLLYQEVSRWIKERRAGMPLRVTVQVR